MPSPFSCTPVIRECSSKKTQVEKKQNKTNSPITVTLHLAGPGIGFVFEKGIFTSK